MKKPNNAIQKLANELFQFAKSDFHPFTYFYTLVFIFVCIFLNYSTGFYATVMRESYFNNSSLWAFPLFYGVTYYSVAIPVLLFQKDFKTLKNGLFYLKSSFFILLYGLAVGYYGYRNWEFASLFSNELQYLYRILSQLKGCVFFIIPLIIIKKLFDKKIVGLYGLASNPKHISGYLLLFSFLLPFLVFVSFTPDFLNAYPQYRPWQYEAIFGWPTWVSTLIFEVSYSMDFVMTELIFRGALVIGLISILGRNAVLPMVAMYAAIHFGKPLGETISSVAGGYILGALAYQTRHIWGGVIVHICVALTMEIMGFIHFYILKN